MTTKDTDDRRHFQRILFDAPVFFTYDDKQFETKMIDISLNGALLESPESFDGNLGAHLMLTIQLGDEISIDMEAQLAHQEKRQLGLHCVHIDMESIGHLRRLVELNLGDEKLLERELSALG